MVKPVDEGAERPPDEVLFEVLPVASRVPPGVVPVSRRVGVAKVPVAGFSAVPETGPPERSLNAPPIFVLLK